jgi:hypothetical protein
MGAGDVLRFLKNEYTDVHVTMLQIIRHLEVLCRTMNWFWPLEKAGRPGRFMVTCGGT